MQTFSAPNVPSGAPPEMQAYAQALHQQIYEAAGRANDFLPARELNVAPTRPKTGFYVADGTNWNPGSGNGLYYYSETAAAYTFVGGTSSGTVTSASVASANGFSGTVATASTTPVITLKTTITGLLLGNGTAVSAASAGTDFVAPNGALGTPSSGTLTSCTGLPVSSGISGLAAGVATFLATPSSLNLKTAVTDETGSGALVFATSPALVTPLLGTPTSGVLTSCTGLPISTGVSGLAAGVATFLATPSSANLAAAITDESGTGALLFAGGNIGAATGTSLAVTGALTSSGGGIGYAAGAGSTGSQATSKATTVAFNALCGTITMNAAALAAATTVSFTFTNTFIAAGDFVAVQHSSAGTLGAYNFAVTPAAGSCSIAVRNVHTASLSEAIVLRFFVNKAVTA